MYCKICGKTVKSISHWAKEHQSMLRKRSKAARSEKKTNTTKNHAFNASEIKKLKKLLKKI